MSSTYDLWLTRSAKKLTRIPKVGRERAVAIAGGASAKTLQEPPFSLPAEMAARVVRQTYEMFDIPSGGGKNKRRELLAAVLKRYALDNPQDPEGLEGLDLSKEEPVP